MPEVWFAGQFALVLLGMWAGTRVARQPASIWKPVAILATLATLAWPFTRFFPTYGLRVLGAGVMVFTEGVGVVIPAAALFSIAACHCKTASERRMIRLLLVVCLMFFVKTGLWMVRPEVPLLGPTKWWNRQVCMQSTGYTCVAASLVTLLHAHGIDATEAEMARLSFTEVNGGTTDTRAVYALQRKLSGLPVEPHYAVMDYEQLRRTVMPCVVAIDWGYFVSHMVPVLRADAKEVVLGDPLSGPRAMSVADFQAVWKNRGIYLMDSRLAPERKAQPSR